MFIISLSFIGCNAIQTITDGKTRVPSSFFDKAYASSYDAPAIISSKLGITSDFSPSGAFSKHSIKNVDIKKGT